MPGVPSSRGCDSCRRQKKKCDEAKPACGRCARLEIECKGAGTQRFKFQVYTSQRRRAKNNSPSSGGRQPPCPSGALSGAPSGALSGTAQTAITGCLVSALQVTDPRFDLSVYGPFLREIPRRVGHSPVLDTAVSAFTVAIPLAMAAPSPNLLRRSPAPRQPTVQMLHHYGCALAMLRTSLSSRQSIAAPDTLCALYLVVIVQGWLSQEAAALPSHGEAIAEILSAMKGHEAAWGEFEEGIIKTLSFLVTMESFVNPRIQLDAHPRRVTGPQPLRAGAEINCLSNEFLSDVARCLRVPHSHTSGLIAAYDCVRADRARYAGRIASIPVVPSADGLLLMPPTAGLCCVHMRLQTGYATLTLVAIRIAAVLSGLSSSTEGRPLDDDFRIYVNDLATVAEQAIQYYPLGSSCMPLCLLAAYATLSCMGDSPQQQARIVRLFNQYRPGVDFEQEWRRISQAGKDRTVRRSIRPPAGRAADVELTKHDLCCVL